MPTAKGFYRGGYCATGVRALTPRWQEGLLRSCTKLTRARLASPLSDAVALAILTPRRRCPSSLLKAYSAQSSLAARYPQSALSTLVRLSRLPPLAQLPQHEGLE